MKSLGKKHRIICLAAAVSLLICVIFGSGIAVRAENKRTVRIPCGINSLLYFDENGDPAGYCSEYLDVLAKNNNWEYEYVDVTWSQAVTMLETGELDIIFPTTLTPERAETMDFSDIVGGYTASGLFVKAESDFGYDDYASFNGARIAVTQGSTNEASLIKFAAEHNFTYEPVYIETMGDKTAALENGEVDMIMFSASNQLSGTKLVSIFDAEPFYYAVKKGNSELLSELNAGMQEMLLHHSDLVSQIFSSSMVGANTVNRIALTNEEQELVDNKTPIVVGFYEDTEPISYVDSNGVYKGIYIELMEAVKEATGLNIELRPIDRMDYWQDLIDDGTIDFYIASSDAIDMEAEGIIMTSSFMDYETVLVTKNDYDIYNRDDVKMAITKARAHWENDLRRDFKNAEVIYCDTAKDCLLAVKSGRADATLLNTLEYNYQSKNTRFSTLVQWTNFTAKSGTAMTASKDIDPVVFSAMDKALSALNDSAVSEIMNKNLNMTYDTSDIMDSLYSARYILIATAAVLVVLFLILTLVYRFRRDRQELEREMREKEREQLRIMAAMSLDYSAVYYVNLNTDTYRIVEMTNRLRSEVEAVATKSQVFTAAMLQYTDLFVTDENQEMIKDLIKPKKLIERFKEEKDFVVRYRVKPNDRGQEYFEMHFVDASREEGEHMMVLGFRCIDVIAREEIAQRTALQAAYDAANGASRAKSDFLSRMSHDIRTPMNAIIGMTAIAAANIDDKERVKDALGKITSSSRHLLALINEVLDMSKIESGKIDLTEEEFNLPELINDVLLMVQPQIAQHGHNLEAHILNIEHEDVIGDSLRLQQALVNIMGNAVKYTPDRGDIRMTVREKSFKENLYGIYEFVVEDNGIGMTKEFIERIFEPFARAEDVRISKIQGTGLGMAITRNIVRMMNGDIQVESEEGKGSRFTVTIFLKLQDKRNMDVEELADLPVLVADDDQIACETTCHMLDEIGMKSEWVLSGSEAVERVREARGKAKDFYAVILDWKMPEPDGVETARQIRKIVGPEVPVIILSAYDWSEIEIEAREAGVDAFLSKPVFKSGLVNVFKKLNAGAAGAETVKQALDVVKESDYAEKRALLVEDNDLNREIAEEILQMTDMRVETAVNGKEALDKFAASGAGYYDIIFMDVQMPVMNGYEATRAIRALDREDAKTVPIVAMTANAFAEDVKASKDAGMDDHLAKPLDFNKLTDILKKYLG